MGKPSHKLFPRGAELIPSLFGQIETLLLVAVEEAWELGCSVGIHDHRILLIIPTCEQMLPVSYEALMSTADRSVANLPCIFEPDANSIFNSVLPLYIRSMMQEVFTESCASEQASRVMAMQTASDNAKELLDELNLEYNKLRQQGITTELLDILGGQVER